MKFACLRDDDRARTRAEQTGLVSTLASVRHDIERSADRMVSRMAHDPAVAKIVASCDSSPPAAPFRQPVVPPQSHDDDTKRGRTPRSNTNALHSAHGPAVAPGHYMQAGAAMPESVAGQHLAIQIPSPVGRSPLGARPVVHAHVSGGIVIPRPTSAYGKLTSPATTPTALSSSGATAAPWTRAQTRKNRRSRSFDLQGTRDSPPASQVPPASAHVSPTFLRPPNSARM